MVTTGLCDIYLSFFPDFADDHLVTVCHNCHRDTCETLSIYDIIKLASPNGNINGSAIHTVFLCCASTKCYVSLHGL